MVIGFDLFAILPTILFCTTFDVGVVSGFLQWSQILLLMICSTLRMGSVGISCGFPDLSLVVFVCHYMDSFY